MQKTKLNRISKRILEFRILKRDLFKKEKSLEAYCASSCVSLNKLPKSEVITTLVMSPEVVTL